MTKRSSSDIANKVAGGSGASKGASETLKPYEPPRILSIEALEAVAAVCEVTPTSPNQVAFGKHGLCVEAQS